MAPLLTFVDIWITTYLPRLVNVFCERPPNGSISLKITCVEFTSSSMWSVNSAMHLDERIEFAPPYVLDFVGNLTHN